VTSKRIEFDLLAACCRWPQDAAAGERIAALAHCVDWDRFRRIAARHRAEGLAYHALGRSGVHVPEDHRSALHAAAAFVARRNVSLAGAALQLSQHFRGAGVPLLFVKGISLASLAYGTISLKAGWDIDLLIDRHRLGDSARVLARAGYRLKEPGGGLNLDRLERWHLLSKESVWRHDQTGLHVELHTRLVDNPRLLQGVGMASPTQAVEIASGATLETLATDELFAYLCVHGASSGWFRLKWLADVAALLARCSPGEIDRLHQRARQLGAGRAADLAVILSTRLVGTAADPRLIERLEASRSNRWMAAACLSLLRGRSAEAELDRLALGTAPIHLIQFGLLPGWRYQYSELKRQIAIAGLNRRARRWGEGVQRNEYGLA
jgi:hypothetical protein